MKQNKFEDIKTGDTILVTRSVAYGRYPCQSHKAFNVLDEVSRVTKTQFTTKGNLRFRKSDGRGIGTSFWAFYKGKNVNFYGHEEYKEDQTEDYHNFKSLVKQVDLVNNGLYDLGRLRVSPDCIEKRLADNLLTYIEWIKSTIEHLNNPDNGYKK